MILCDYILFDKLKIMSFSNTLNSESKKLIEEGMIERMIDNELHFSSENLTWTINSISDKILHSLEESEKPIFNQDEDYESSWAFFDVLYKEKLINLWFDWIDKELRKKWKVVKKIEDDITRKHFWWIGWEQTSKLIKDTKKDIKTVVRFTDWHPLVEIKRI